VISITAPR